MVVCCGYMLSHAGGGVLREGLFFQSQVRFVLIHKTNFGDEK